MLYCELTDGSDSVYALETSPLGPKLSDNLPSGTKVGRDGVICVSLCVNMNMSQL